MAADTQVEQRRRTFLQTLGLGGGLVLAGCGGGGSAASGGSGASTGSGSGSGATTAATTPTWPWTTATSTLARLPSLADFMTVVPAGGRVTYGFRVTTTSTTVDPITGAQADTSATAVLQPYLMSRYLVTNAQWKAFCDAQGSRYWPSTAGTAGRYWAGGAYPAGKEDHPVFFVSLTAAQAYCAWLETQLPGYRFYVPTEGEWEYAALGTQASYVYPWGASAGISYASGVLTSPFNCNAVCTAYVLSAASGLNTLTYYNDSTVTTLSDGITPLTADTAALARVLSLSSSGAVTGWQYDSDTNKTWADFANSDAYVDLVQVLGGFSSAVGAYPAGVSWCGCHDMAGNAYEWTTTQNLASNGAESGTLVQVVKGGSWYSTSMSGRSTGRGEGRAPSGAFHSVGFRVAARPR
jgi:formylglycine-generating enzyme required for sulfatase activity